MQRRTFLSTGCALFALQPSLPAQSGQAGETLIHRAWRAYQAKDYGGAERLLRAYLEAEPPSEPVLRLLTLALLKQGRTQEALALARRNHRDFACPWSTAALTQVQIAVGDYAGAQQNLRTLDAVRAQWGDAGDTIRDLRSEMSVKEWHFLWPVAPTKYRETGLPLSLPIPWKDDRIQTDATVSVEGAEAWSIKRDDVGNSYAEVFPRRGAGFKMSATVTIRPFSYIPHLGQVRAGEYPQEVRRYLGKSTGLGRNGEDIFDPWQPAVLEVAQALQDASPVRSAENVMRWCQKNLTFCPPGGPPPGGNDLVGILKRRGSHCEGLSSMVVALCRACGIPARFIRGHSAILPVQGSPKQHTIPQFYLNGIGWIEWDHGRPYWVARHTFLRRQHYACAGDPAYLRLSFLDSIDTSNTTYQFSLKREWL